MVTEQQFSKQFYLQLLTAYCLVLAFCFRFFVCLFVCFCSKVYSIASSFWDTSFDLSRAKKFCQKFFHELTEKGEIATGELLFTLFLFFLNVSCFEECPLL